MWNKWKLEWGRENSKSNKRRTSERGRTGAERYYMKGRWDICCAMTCVSSACCSGHASRCNGCFCRFALFFPHDAWFSCGLFPNYFMTRSGADFKCSDSEYLNSFSQSTCPRNSGTCICGPERRWYKWIIFRQKPIADSPMMVDVIPLQATFHLLNTLHFNLNLKRS